MDCIYYAYVCLFFPVISQVQFQVAHTHTHRKTPLHTHSQSLSRKNCARNLITFKCKNCATTRSLRSIYDICMPIWYIVVVWYSM